MFVQKLKNKINILNYLLNLLKVGNIMKIELNRFKK